jgi:hypothetical protein
MKDLGEGTRDRHEWPHFGLQRADLGFLRARLTSQGMGHYDDGRIVQDEWMGAGLVCTLGEKNGYGDGECGWEHSERRWDLQSG